MLSKAARARRMAVRVIAPRSPQAIGNVRASGLVIDRSATMKENGRPYVEAGPSREADHRLVASGVPDADATESKEAEHRQRG